MTSLRKGLTWLLLAVCTGFTAGAWAEDPLHITQAEVLNVTGDHFTAAPYTVVSETLPGVWRTVSLPHLVRNELPPTPLTATPSQARNITWYKLQLPKIVLANSPKFLYIPRFKTSGELAIYSNGDLIYRTHPGLFWSSRNTPQWVLLDNIPNAGRINEVLLRIESPYEFPDWISTIWIGNQASLRWQYQMRFALQNQLPYTISGIFVNTGFIALIAWIFQRGKLVYLYYFLFSILSFVKTWPYLLIQDGKMAVNSWPEWLSVSTQFIFILFTHYFLSHLHRRPSRILNKSLLAITLFFCIATSPLSINFFNLQDDSIWTYSAMIILSFIVGTNGLYKSYGKSNYAVFLSLFSCLTSLFWLHDSLMNKWLIDIEGFYWSAYSNSFVFYFLVTFIINNYLGALNEAKFVNANMASRLNEQEEELAENHRVQSQLQHSKTLLDERQRMMQDMHDGIGSSLRTALLMIEKGQIGLPKVAEIVNVCIDDLKLAVDAMEPLQGDLLLLLASLRYRLGPRLENAGYTLIWNVANTPKLEWIDPGKALHILRILQEAFSNIISHSQANEITIDTDVSENWVDVIIKDNGKGFDTSTVFSKEGKGLKNQISRAKSIRAEIFWNSNSSGTKLTLRLPVHA